MNSHFSLIPAVVVAIAASLLPVAGNAAHVTLRLTGTVASTSPTLADAGVLPGAAFSGTYTIDTTVPDIDPGDSDLGFYSQAVTSLRFSVGGILAEIPSSGFSSSSVRIFDRPTSSGGDVYELNISIVTNVVELGSIFFALSLGDRTGAVFSSDALPAVFPALSEFELDNPFSLFLMQDDLGGTALLTIDSHLQVVPVPPAALLFLSSLFSVALARRVRR